MSEALSVADVRAVLEPRGIEVVTLPADTSTAVLAAGALHTEVASIVKSLLFMADGAPVLVLAAGDRRVNMEQLKSLLGAHAARFARPSEVLEITGYAVGGVPPVAHRHRLPVLLDRTLFDHETVYAAAGSSNDIFPVTPARLVDLAGATVVDITIP